MITHRCTNFFEEYSRDTEFPQGVNRSNMYRGYRTDTKDSRIYMSKIDLDIKTLTRENMATAIKQLDTVSHKIFTSLVFKALCKHFTQEDIELFNSVHDLNAGNITANIKEDNIYKRSISKKPNWIEVYRNGRFTPLKERRKKRKNEHHFIEMLIISYKLNIGNAILLDKAISNISEKNSDGSRFASETGGSYAKLSTKLQEMFFEEFIYKNNNGTKRIGYRVRNNKHIQNKVESYLVELEGINKQTAGYQVQKNKYLQVKIIDIQKMSLYGQIQILKNTVFVENFIAFVKLNTKQDIGNYGRQYNTLNEIPRLDRELISNLYGVDMATAIQRILLNDVKDKTLTYTKSLIENKTATRKEVQRLLKLKTIQDAKQEITAIYQGRWYKNKYKPIKVIFDERDEIAKEIIKRRHNNDTRTEYARTRTSTKLDEKFKDVMVCLEDYDYLPKDNQQHIRNTFLYFYWTFVERQIQNLIAKQFKNPITLHDAVYTQEFGEFQTIDTQRIQQEIKEKLHIDIELDLTTGQKSA